MLRDGELLRDGLTDLLGEEDRDGEVVLLGVDVRVRVGVVLLFVRLGVTDLLGVDLEGLVLREGLVLVGDVLLLGDVVFVRCVFDLEGLVVRDGLVVLRDGVTVRLGVVVRLGDVVRLGVVLVGALFERLGDVLLPLLTFRVVVALGVVVLLDLDGVVL